MWRLRERADRQMSGDMAASSASGRKGLRDERGATPRFALKSWEKEMQIRNCAKRRELRRQCAGSTLISTPIPPELLSQFEPVAREQLKQVVTNRVSQFFTVDSYRVEGMDPLVVRFLGEKITYVGRTETERKPYQYRLTLRYTGRKRDPRAGDTPMDRYKTPEINRRAVEVLAAGEGFGNPMMAPPGTPVERVKILREAYAKVLRDPELIAEAQKGRWSIEPVSGEELRSLADRIMVQPPEVWVRSKRS
jgi:hypothetical protein